MSTHPLIWVIFIAMSMVFPVQANDDSDIPLSIIKRIQAPFWGDLDALRERRIIRVLVSYNRTNFFVTKKGYRGLEHDFLHAYESYLNRGPLRQRYKTQLVYIPLPFKDLFKNLRAGRGDIAASGLTIIPEREAMVDFTRPYINNIHEVLVTNKDIPKVQCLEDLAGKKIVVVANSSYVVHLHKFNQALGRKALPAMEIIQADPILESEDLLDMVNAGIYDYTVVDDHIANIWSQILDNLDIQDQMIFHYNGEIGWALNKDLPKLKKSLNTFIRNYARPGKFLGNSTYRKYFENTFFLEKPLTNDLLKKVDCLSDYLHLYGDYFGFDWNLLAAQAYQESRFNQKLKSHRGAVGIMQIKPATAKERYVRIKNIHKLENNIHAGVKYLAFLRDHYFSADKYSEEDKVNFALAAYNAGPNKIKRLRKKAEAAGLDPNKWFYNVEIIARNEIGHETVDYVANIQKTQLFLKASHEIDLQRRLYHLEREKEAKEAEWKAEQAEIMAEKAAKTAEIVQADKEAASKAPPFFD